MNNNYSFNLLKCACLPLMLVVMNISCVSNNATYAFAQSLKDRVIGCLHWIACPYCIKDTGRQRKNFLAAIEQNRPDIIEHIVRRRFLDPNDKITEIRLPLALAAEKGHVESVQMLLKLGAHVDEPIVDFKKASVTSPTALIAACSGENSSQPSYAERVAQIVQALIDKGADPSLRFPWQTASEKAEIKRISEAIKNNKPVATEDKDKALSWLHQDRTAMDFAVKHKYGSAIAIIRAALEKLKKAEIS